MPSTLRTATDITFSAGRAILTEKVARYSAGHGPTRMRSFITATGRRVRAIDVIAWTAA